MSTPKNVIRKFAPFASFQKFLVSENSVGNITRQEIVSMIPPLLLDVQPGMTVLDLCAAPGSKSAQIIEMVHGGEEARVRKVLEKIARQEGREMSPSGMEVAVEKDQADNEDDYSDDGRPTGLLIANDVDYRRAQLLIHQCKRLNSPNLIITNHDATLFPSIRVPSPEGSPARYLKFDRVLADVPCSGDGTARKNLNVWKDWIPGNAIGLHVTQVRILVRSLQMLKVGGRVVYSTCSMNPMENEAVVAAAIDRCGGVDKVALLDRSEALPGLRRKPGLTSWNIMDKSGRTWSSWSSVQEVKKTEPEGGHSKLVESMFPPSEAEHIPLPYCMRVYPHLQDTGGFFIAVLEKRSEIKTRPEGEPKPAHTAPATKPQTAPAATAPPVTSITALVNEIQSQSATEASHLGHLHSLDAMAPPHQLTHDDGSSGSSAPAAARQNRANTSDTPISARKRALDDAADADAATKRMRTRGDDAGPAEEGDEDRMVHWPPPPGADLELTAHHHDSTAAPSLPTPAASTPASAPTPPSARSTNPRRTNNVGAVHEEPFKYLSPTHPDLTAISDFYALAPRFPRDRFMVRNATGHPAKAIYYTSALARDILTTNEGSGIKFVHCGVKMFVRQDVQGNADACRWRIQSEGMSLVESCVGEERIVRCTHRATLRMLLKEMFPRVAGGAWRELGEVGEQVRGVGVGCCVLRVEPSADIAAEEAFEERLVMPLWRGVSSLNLMLPKEERRAMLLRLYNDDEPLIDHSKMKREGVSGDGDAEDGPAAISEADEDESADAAGEDTADVEEEGIVAKETEANGPSAGAAAQAALQVQGEKEDNAAQAEAQDAAEKTRETAAGVVDEDDSFNKTV